MPEMKVSNTLSGYMPILDGWRGIAIVLVLLHHSRVSGSIPVIGPFLKQLTETGSSGVWVFFAISGLLICDRMLQEERRQGRISLRNFYIRRVFRILPAVLLYLLTLAVLSPFLGVSRLELVSSLFFFRNYVLAGFTDAHWFTGHLWSLAVVEHFYLLLPGIMVFFPRRRAWVLGALTCAVVAWRMAAHRFSLDRAYRTDLVLDALLIAALLAIAANNDRCAAYLRRLLTPLFLVVLAAMYVAMLYIKVPFHLVLRSAILPLMLLSTLQRPASLVGQILQSAPLRWSGRLSFSLYLWQQLFLCDTWRHGALPLGVAQRWPLNFGGLFGCACISYYFLERPMNRLGHRIASSDVPGRVVDQAPALEPIASIQPESAR
jgi:peptidoglycan/LPS O-acetylase OafA/YrhL